jgi:polar amino acid transport system substrate-binding protein
MTPRHALAAATALLALMTAGPLNATEIHFVTETYPPFNFMDQQTLKGSSVDQIKLIMKDSGIGYSMEIMPWARALALATTQEDYCVFTTVHNAERDARFKWVEPLLKSRTLLIRKTGSQAAPKTLDEAKEFIVGTQRDDFTQDILQDNHFPKIDIATDLGLTMKKLMSGRIDLMPISDKYYEKLKRDGASIEAVLTLAESTYSIACNKSVPDKAIDLMQQGLDKIIADGTQDRLFEAYGLSKDTQ